MRTKGLLSVGIVASASLGASVMTAEAETFDIQLSGFQEVPSVSTPASGRFELFPSPDGGVTFPYTLTWNNLEGEITQAHIHFAQEGVNGGIMIWLCVNGAFIQVPANAFPPECSGVSDSVSDSFTAEDVVGPEGQGIEPEDLAAALEAIRGGVAYVNLHSEVFPTGELRGQLETGKDFENHTHTYLTGRGVGHNNARAETSTPDGGLEVVPSHPVTIQPAPSKKPAKTQRARSNKKRRSNSTTRFRGGNNAARPASVQGSGANAPLR